MLDLYSLITYSIFFHPSLSSVACIKESVEDDVASLILERGSEDLKMQGRISD